MTRTRNRHSGARSTWLARGTVLALAAATLTVPLAVMTGAEAARIQPRTTSPTTTLAVIKVIGVGNTPKGVAINNEDDTVYVTNAGSDNVSVINGRTGQRTDDTISVGNYPEAIALDQNDDTVYVVNSTSDNVSVINGRTAQRDDTITIAGGPFDLRDIAVDQNDDTVYVTRSNGVTAINGRTRTPTAVTGIPLGPPAISSFQGVAVNQGDDTVYVSSSIVNPLLSVISGRATAYVSSVGVGGNPSGVAVNQEDDTVYVANSGSNNVSVINGRTGQRTDDTITGVGSYPQAIAVDQNDDTVYVTGSSSLSVINGRTRQVSGPNLSVSGAGGVAVDDSGTNAGLVYVTSTSSVSVIGRVTPTLVDDSGAVGDSVRIDVDVPQVDYEVDPGTIASVTFGSAPATGLTAGAGDTWTVTAPAGSGTVAVTVTFKGGRSAPAGDFTYTGSAPPGPTPPAPTPASAPLDVTATAGDASATVTWKAPASSGDYPITDYQAIASPGGRTCLISAPALTCEVTGLTNGTAYTFTVQALTGAGWGATSAASNAVTPTAPPRPTITITGSRDGQRIVVSGTSTELAGKTLRPWIRFPGQTSYTEGITAITPSADGRFTWQRKTGKKAYVYIAHESTRSNTVTIPAQ